jgi:hypothetical protein
MFRCQSVQSRSLLCVGAVVDEPDGAVPTPVAERLQSSRDLVGAVPVDDDNVYHSTTPLTTHVHTSMCKCRLR